jgi:ketosteroid isomerase-like protein
MRALIAQLERQLGVDWARIVEWMREANPVDAIENRLRERGIAGDLVKETAAAAERFAASVNEATATSGKAAAKWLDGKVPDSLISYNGTNYRAVSQAQQNRYQLIREISDEQRTVVRRAVSEGVARGDNPRVIARDIRESIGLTETQAGYVTSYRRALESGDYDNALGRQLSDGRSDRTIRRIRSEGGALTPEQIDDMTERYRKNFVAFRAETIARTESLRAANDGTRELFKQAVERSDLLATELETTWHAGPSTGARASHQAMDGVAVKFGQEFTLPDGTRMTGPGDPRGGAKHNANCRCTTSTTYRAV